MADLAELITLPFAFGFMQQALFVSLLSAVPLALLSCIVVLRGWSLMGNALSHAVLPGVALATVLGAPVAIGAFISGFACVALTGWLQTTIRIRPDTALAVTFSAFFAAGILLVRAFDNGLHVDHILFGDVLGLDWPDVAQALILAAGLTAICLAFMKDWLLTGFDPLQARAIGLRTQVLHYGLLAVIAVAVVAALKSIGIILAIALIIIPGATASLLTQRFSRMLLIAVAFTAVTTLIAVWASFWLDSAPAPTIVLLQSALFALAFAGQRLRTRQPQAA